MKQIIIVIAMLFGQAYSYASFNPSGQSIQNEIDPAQAAIAVKNLDLLKQAIAGGSDVNQKFAFIWTVTPYSSIQFEKATLLMYAISVNWYEGVLELIKSGAKTNVYVKGMTPVNIEFDRCTVKKIPEMSDMMMAVMAGNPDIVKLMIIDGCDTRGTIAVELPKNCQTATSTGGLMNMRAVASPEIQEILKEGKKAEWAKKGLPQEGKRPGN